MKQFILFILLFPLFYSGQSSFYNTSVIQKIEIQFAQANWDYMLDTARYKKDGYVMATWVKINGERFDNVGVKYKGNSSYDSTYTKNPIHIELNTYRNQDYQGFTDIKLNNNYGDPSMMREVMAYEIARTYMDAPQANFAKVYINGKYKGVYTNTESANKSFLANHFYSNENIFIKCNPKLTPSPNVKSNLKFIVNADSSAYFNYYELKSDYGWNQLKALTDSITNKPSNISSILDVDRVIWMLAFNSVLVNLDSYTGAFAQNYYLYKDKTQRFNPIVWDLNMCFAGFPFLGNSNSSLGTLSVPGEQNMPLAIHATDSYWPLINAIHSNSTYKKMYIAHAKTIVNEMLASSTYTAKYDTYKNLIDTSVASDPGKFFSYNHFQNAFTTNYAVGTYTIPGIKTLIDGRVTYLQSTSDFTLTTPVITQVKTTTPLLNNLVTITASVTNVTSSNVFLNYRFSKTQKFIKVPMFDDGLHNDGTAGDNVFGTSLNLSANQTQYYIYAENNSAGIFSPERAEHEFYTIQLYPSPQPGQLVINEFLANNKSDVKNEFHLNEDWIELYNTTSNTLNLEGFYLSDDGGLKPKYEFPLTTAIKPYNFLTIWADNIQNNSALLHSNFKLNDKFGWIFLGNGSYQILDSYFYSNQESDKSTGRCPDGDGPYKTLNYPSFGLVNCVVGLEKSYLINNLKIYPNPANTNFFVDTDNEAKKELTIQNIMGQEVWKQYFHEKQEVNCQNWSPGIYIVTLGTQSTKLIITK